MTEKEFTDKIDTAYPNAVFWHYPDDFDGKQVVYNLDYDPGIGPMNRATSFERLQIARFAFKDGVVLKDRVGLFHNPGVPVYTYNFTAPTAINWSNVTINWDLIPPDSGIIKPKKCECGAHSVGSNGHSDWCQMKGIA